MFQDMKSIILLIAALTVPTMAGSWDPDLGTLPSATGQSPRYQLVQGTIIDKHGSALPQTIRLDTWTGETWMLTNLGAQTWSRVPEADARVLEQVRAMQASERK